MDIPDAFTGLHGISFFGDINNGGVWAVRQSGGKLAGYKDGLIHRMDGERFGPVATRAGT